MERCPKCGKRMWPWNKSSCWWGDTVTVICKECHKEIRMKFHVDVEERHQVITC